MTNLWLWNYDRNPWKLSGIDTFYSTRKYSRNLKFELISRKIGLVFLHDGTWYTWTFSLPSTWVQLPWWKIVRCFKSGLHCTRLYIALKAQKLLEVSEVFWSFTCKFKSKLLCTQSRLTKSKGRNIKLRCYRESRNSNSGTSNVFSETTPWLQTPMTRNSTAIMPMDIHKQAIEKKCREVEFERQTVRTKATRSALRLCLHTVDRTFIYTNFLLLWIWQI